MKQLERKEEYLTSRHLKSAASKGFKEASVNAMKVAESIVVAQGGWVVRVHKDGKIEKLSKIPKVSTSKLDFD